VLLVGAFVVAPETGHVGDLTEVLELVRVDDAAQRLDHAVVHFERDNADNLALGIVGDDPRVPVDEYRVCGYPTPGCLIEHGNDEGGNVVPSVERLANGGRLAAPIAVEDGVCGQKVHQLVQIAAPRRGEEGSEQSLTVVARCFVTDVMGIEMLAGPDEDLAAVGLALSMIRPMSS
jgi:hypothetical protein